MARLQKFFSTLIILLLIVALARSGSSAEDEDRGRKKEKDYKGYKRSQEEEPRDDYKGFKKPQGEDETWASAAQKDERDFVIFLSKCLIVSWLAILALVVGFIYKYKQAKTAQQLAEEAERQKRKNEREKKLLTRTLSKTPSQLLKRDSLKIKKDVVGDAIKAAAEGLESSGTKQPTAVPEAGATPTDPDASRQTAPAPTEERDWYLKKIAELEKLLKEEKDKRLKLKKDHKDLKAEKATFDEQLEEEKKKYEELENLHHEEMQQWEERLEAAFKDKCLEEGKCVELNKRIEEEKAKNAELDKKNVEQAVLLEGERRKYAELNKQFEELNTTLMEMLTSVDKKRQEKRKKDQVDEDPIDDEDLPL